MAEVLFYHLTTAPLEASLPEMLERSLARGWRVVLRAGSKAGLARLDAQLWSYRDDAFLPHGRAEMGAPEHQPIYLTCGTEAPNGARVLVLVEDARIRPQEIDGFERVCLMFDGNDAAALDAARADWRVVTDGKWAAKYWAQEDGRWVQRANSAAG